MLSSLSVPPTTTVHNVATTSQRITPSKQGVDSVCDTVATVNANTGTTFSNLTESTTRTGRDAPDTSSQDSVRVPAIRPTTERAGTTVLSQFIQSSHEDKAASVEGSTTVEITSVESNKCRSSQKVVDVSVWSTHQPHTLSSVPPPMDVTSISTPQDLFQTVGHSVGCNLLAPSSSGQLHCVNGTNHDCVTHDNNMDIDAQVPNTERENEESQNITRRRKRQKEKDCVQVEEMDHSGEKSNKFSN